ncbi:ABC transporter permease [Clostridium beijerinckii]|uniref:ABC transporter permease n=1 Tax=Clostridium beijerinckii TaxID=1520 RepID=UPI00080A07BC|nr:ABC transporter permease [Clostridium beijerinckii]OCA97212.1 hypothetical protein BGS1_05550 [Clostridium beijerinckii]
MTNLIKMIFYRILKNKAYLFMPIIVTPLVILASISFTMNSSIKANIAVIGMDNSNLSIKDVKVTSIEEQPKFSDLVQDKYDAIVMYENGKYNIETVKGETFKTALEDALNGKTPSWGNDLKRGTISNLVGFITMFILLVSVMLYRFYYEEKNGINKRILSSTINYIEYSLAHCTIVFTMIFMPTILIILLYSGIWGFNSNVSNLQLILIFFVLCFLGTALGFMISSIVKYDQNATLIGAMLVIITTLLSGSFRPVPQQGLAKIISEMLPQKYILDFPLAIENYKNVNYISIIIILIFSIVLIFLGIIINKRKLETNNI